MVQVRQLRDKRKVGAETEGLGGGGEHIWRILAFIEYLGKDTLRDLRRDLLHDPRRFCCSNKERRILIGFSKVRYYARAIFPN
ncbi:hypothetical protein F511_33201 [Dorcoceras hygrometricum]|uniref:Uncharacterized protein n=1 Tax=Dorcoceras hygrometricum TaxID=472368 RepID=A0A2Z7C6U2_9LAMI|nr:hypothetical protein F511_33201 [Dorcoceras hygrometricum]